MPKNVSPHFDVDKDGLAKILARKGPEFAITELVQNCWDEDVSTVTATLVPHEKRGRHLLRVEDDSPEGFKDLAHAYTLFADSYKKDNPELRGRFNLGEKLVIALCDEAEVRSTTGTVRFDGEGRTHHDITTEQGTVFKALIRMTRREAEKVAKLVTELIPPEGVETTFNGDPLLHRPLLREFSARMQTEIADEDGLLKRVWRRGRVKVYAPLPGEKASLYEMGIPVVETGDSWHISVEQKVPLTTDRDNVPPAYLRHLRAEVLNNCADLLTEDDAGEQWVGNALEDKDISEEAVVAAMDKRFGKKRVITDPSDREGTALAQSLGYEVIGSRSLSKAAFANVKKFDAAKPAGQVTPSPRVVAGNAGEDRSVDPDDWNDDMRNIAAYVEGLATHLLGFPIRVKYHNDSTYGFSAWYGGRQLTFNVGRLGYRFFAQGPTVALNRLVIHELGHEYSGNHLSHDYHDALCKLGAKLAKLALDEPQFFGAFAGDGEEIETEEVPV